MGSPNSLLKINTWPKRRLIYYGLLLFICYCCIQSQAWAQVSTEITNEECLRCHISDIPTLKTGADLLFQYTEKDLVADEFICFGCHDGTVLDDRMTTWTDKRHLTDVVPSLDVNIPANFPLDKQGRIYCGTCHSPHSIEGKSNLRGIAKNSLICMECHQVKGVGTEKGSHPVMVPVTRVSEKIISGGAQYGINDKNEKILICETCHVVHGAPPGEKILIKPVSGKGVTRSELCESCHDENPSRPKHGFGQQSHAVNQKPDKTKLPKIWTNGDKVVLGSEGKVICRTCHVSHRAAEKSKLLIVSNARGLFCIQCHPEKDREGSKLENRGTHSIGVPLKKGMKPNEIIKLEDKRITCNTCHKSHNAFDSPQKNLLISDNKDSALCDLCHAEVTTMTLGEARGAGTHPVNIIPDERYELPKILKDNGAILGEKGQMVCGSCHRMHGGKVGSSNLILENDKSQLCGVCHQELNTLTIEQAEKNHTHPVNIFSTQIKIPADILSAGGVLGPGGEIVCDTCHRPHQALSDTQNLVFDVKESFLCLKCHADKSSIINSEHNLIEIAPDEKNIRGETVSKSKGGVCSACHLTHYGREAKNWAKEVDGQGDIISQLCNSCHQKDECAGKKVVGKHTHPVQANIKNADGKTTLPLYYENGVEIPEDVLILQSSKGESMDGYVTCATCHDVHQWDPHDPTKGTTKNTEGDLSNSFLRITNENSRLCINCHSDQNRYLGNTEHDMTVTAPNDKNILDQTVSEKGLCSACHLTHNGTGPLIWARKLGVTRDDPFSQVCMATCHEKGGNAEKKTVTAMSHPTGKPMKESNSKTSFPLYSKKGKVLRPTDSKSVKNPEEYYVSCGSCHDAHRWDPNSDEQGRRANIEGDGSNSFLRKPFMGDDPLCLDCHESFTPLIGSEHDLRVTAPKEKNILGQTIERTGPCGVCHLPHQGNGSKVWARKMDTTFSPNSQFCVDTCHIDGECGSKKQTGFVTHSVDMPIMDQRVKTTLPLFDEKGHRTEYGDVACATCHNVHQWDPKVNTKGTGKNEEGTIQNSFLRMKDDKNSILCANCHIENKFIVNTDHDLNITAPKERNINSQTVSESGLCGACHLVHNGMAANLWSKIPGEEGNNMITILCTSCHQKGRAAEKKVTGIFSHTVGISILDKGLTSNLPLYDPAGTRRTDGEITCATCHNPHRWDPVFEEVENEKNEEGDGSNSFLRIDNLESFLCIDCHQREQMVVNTDHDLAITGPNLKNIMDKTVLESGICSPCHVPHQGFNVFGWSRPLNEEAGEDPITQMCGSCHKEGGAAESKNRADVTALLAGPGNHPVNKKMSDWMISSLPEFDENGKISKEKGKITCMTCHFVHQWSPNQFEKANRSPQMFSGMNFNRIKVGKVYYYSDNVVYIDVDDGKIIKEKDTYAVLKGETIIAYLQVEKLNPFAKEGFEAFAKVISIEDDAIIELDDSVIDHRKLAKGIEGDGNNSFLRKPNSNEAELCFNCHEDKKTLINTDHDLRITAPEEWNRKGLTVRDSGVCSACHTAHNGNQRVMGAKPILKRGWLKSESGYIEGGFPPLCNSCHNRLGAAFKKVAEEVDGNKTGHHLLLPLEPGDREIRLPTAYMPLFTQDGELVDPTELKGVKPTADLFMSCTTCHDPHQWSIENPYLKNKFDENTGKFVNTEGKEKTSFLIVKNDGGDNCEQCHLQQKGVWQWGTKSTDKDNLLDDKNIISSHTESSEGSNQPSEEEISLKLKELMDKDRQQELEIERKEEMEKRSQKAELLGTLSPELQKLLKINNQDDAKKPDGQLGNLQGNLPYVLKYEYEKPVKVTDDFRIKLIFSEAINPRTIPQISFISTAPVTPEVTYITEAPPKGVIDRRYVITTTNISNDTFITSPIKLTSEMGGEITIMVEGAEGILGNRMEREARESFYLDTAPEVLSFYNTARVNVDKKVIYGDQLILKLFASGAQEMIISEHPLFTDTNWQPYKESLTMKIDKKLGTHTIHAKYRRKYKGPTGERALLTDLVSDKFKVARLQKEGEFRDRINQDLVLTKDGSPYIFSGRVVITRGTTVKVEPGVQMLFDTRIYEKEKRSEKGELYIEGKLLAIGEKENPISFSPLKLPATPGDWQGLNFARNVKDATSRLENCKIELARYGIYCKFSSPVIINNRIVNNQMAGIQCEDSSNPIISGNYISKNLMGIYTHLSNPEIFQNEIDNNLANGIILKGSSKAKIEDNLINNNRVGIECQEISSPKISNNVITQNKIGIRCLSYSPPGISRNKISNNEIGIIVDEAVPMIVLNDIIDNQIGIQLKKDFHSFRIKENNIYNNVKFNVQLLEYYVDVEAVENWWGTYDPDKIELSIYDFQDIEEERFKKASWKTDEKETDKPGDGWEELLFSEESESLEEEEFEEEIWEIGRVRIYPFLTEESK